MASYRDYLPVTQNPPLMLDSFRGAHFALSVRKLRNDYAGACMRVRRSSDNAEQDIGFDGTDLDTASLLSFVGAGSGYLHTWYDQSGNSNSPTQATTAAQPLIVASGVLNTEGGKPAIKFDGVDDYLLKTALGARIDQRSIYAVWLSNTAKVFGRVFAIWDGAGNDFNKIQAFAHTQNDSVRNAEAGVIGSSSASYEVYGGLFSTTTPQSLFVENIRGGRGDLFKNGAAFANDTSFNAFATTTTNNLYVGAGNSGVSGVIGSFGDVSIQELVYYPFDTSMVRTLIEANLNSYFQIY